MLSFLAPQAVTNRDTNFTSIPYQINRVRTNYRQVRNSLFDSEGRFVFMWYCLNPFTPKSDQFQISPAASPEILHHTVWGSCLFISYSDEGWLYYQFSLPHLHIFFLKALENLFFELGSVRLKNRSFRDARWCGDPATSHRWELMTGIFVLLQYKNPQAVKTATDGKEGTELYHIGVLTVGFAPLECQILGNAVTF